MYLCRDLVTTCTCRDNSPSSLPLIQPIVLVCELLPVKDCFLQYVCNEMLSILFPSSCAINIFENHLSKYLEVKILHV